MLRQRRVDISQHFAENMATIVNKYQQEQCATLQLEKAKYHKYIKRLRKELAEAAETLEQYAIHSEAQSREILALQTAKYEMSGQLADFEAKLKTSEERFQKLNEKYHTCKTYINSAIDEQQDLYTRSKKHWDEVVEQLRAMERARNAEVEMTVRKAEVIREQMMEKVRQTIAQNKAEATQCKHPTTVLRVYLLS